MRALSEYYTVNLTDITPGKELNALKGSDAIVITKPDSAFTDKEIYTIDQYIMKGARYCGWLIRCSLTLTRCVKALPSASQTRLILKRCCLNMACASILFLFRICNVATSKSIPVFPTARRNLNYSLGILATGIARDRPSYCKKS